MKKIIYTLLIALAMIRCNPLDEVPSISMPTMYYTLEEVSWDGVVDTTFNTIVVYREPEVIARAATNARVSQDEPLAVCTDYHEWEQFTEGGEATWVIGCDEDDFGETIRVFAETVDGKPKWRIEIDNDVSRYNVIRSWYVDYQGNNVDSVYWNSYTTEDGWSYEDDKGFRVWYIDDLWFDPDPDVTDWWNNNPVNEDYGLQDGETEAVQPPMYFTEAIKGSTHNAWRADEIIAGTVPSKSALSDVCYRIEWEYYLEDCLPRLPIIVYDFTARKDGDFCNIVEFKTAEEKNSEVIRLKSSLDGKKWFIVKEWKSSNSPNHYQFSHCIN